MSKARLLVLLCLFAAGCGGGSTATLSAPSPSPVRVSPSPFSTPSPSPVSSPKPPTQPGPHFATPQAAMRYLATAWNRMDVTSLKHVTDPNARQLLIDMYREAADLKLDHCSPRKGLGDFECYFTHGFPKGYKSKGPVGTAEFTVGPADRPGWYMTVFVDCGG